MATSVSYMRGRRGDGGIPSDRGSTPGHLSLSDGDSMVYYGHLSTSVWGKYQSGHATMRSSQTLLHRCMGSKM